MDIFATKMQLGFLGKRYRLANPKETQQGSIWNESKLLNWSLCFDRYRRHLPRQKSRNSG